MTQQAPLFSQDVVLAVPASSQTLDVLQFPLHGARLIEASAGTGKTWSIAMLYLRLVLGHGAGIGRPLMPSEILVMTFTRLATSELSDRIRARLVEGVRCFRGDGDPQGFDPNLQQLRDSYPEGAERQKAAWLLEMAAQGMDDAAIFTIDAWSQRMLREHAFDSGNLFDEQLEPDETQRLDEAVKDYWRQHCYPLQNEDLETVLQICSDVQTLRKSIGPLLNDASFQPDAVTALYDCLQAFARTRRETLSALAQGWEDKAQALQQWVHSQLDAPKKIWNGRKVQLRWVQPQLDKLIEWAADPCHTLDGGAEIARLAIAQWEPALLDGMVAQYPPEMYEIEALIAQLSALPSLRSLVLRHAASCVQQRLQLLKQQAGTFGFADLPRRLAQALDGMRGEELRAGILRQYPVALIDEFQDTSPLQYALFERLYQPQTNAQALDTALLLIGDPKQSIYGFRGADIYSYLRAKHVTAGQHYVLGTNYRSTQALVRAVNHWFAHAEQHPQGAFLFAEDGRNDLPFLPVKAQGRKDVLVQDGGAIPAITVTWDSPDPDTALSAGVARQRQAHLCAHQIVQWLQNPQVGFAEEGQPLRRLRPADIAVLVADRKEAVAIRQALARRNVASVYLSDRDSVFDSQEARDLLYWLRAVATPLDTRAVRAGLATALMNLSFDELKYLACNEEALDAKVQELQKLLKIWHRHGVLAMLRSTLYTLDVTHRWLAQPGGERRMTNYLHLAELLQTASVEHHGELALIRWLATQIQQAGGEENIVRLESESDLIKVVTIHKSKGLEYPVVCLPFMGTFSEYPLRDQYGIAGAVATEAGWVRQWLLEPTGEQKEQAGKERLQEALRLFYVAMTRARHALWLGLAPEAYYKKPSSAYKHAAVSYTLAALDYLQPAQWRDRLQAMAQGCADIQVVDAPAQLPPVTPWQPEAKEPQWQDDVPYSAQFDKRWWVGSYSALTRKSGSVDTATAVQPVAIRQPAADEILPQEQDDPVTLPADAAEDAAETSTTAWSALPLDVGSESVAPWHHFKRGMHAGTFVHEQLEWLAGEDFALPAQPAMLLGDGTPGEGMTELQLRLRRRCERSRFAAHTEAALQWLCAIVNQPLRPLDISLKQLAHEGSLLPEMEFWMPVQHLSAAQLDDLCRQYILPGAERGRLPHSTLQGMLMGSADLVFEHAGRYWVMDYKTNFIAAHPGAYTEDALAEVMLHHRYDVQAAVYTLALHRLLRTRLGERYDPAQHLGGALYFFLRGLDGPAQGMQLVTVPPAMLDALDAMLKAQEQQVQTPEEEAA